MPAEIVFDDLLLGSELDGDLLVLAALNDEGHDLHLLGGKAVADPCADAIGGLHGGHIRALDPALAPSHAAYAIQQVGSGDVAADDAVELSRYLIGDVLCVLGYEDYVVCHGLCAAEELRQIGAQAGGDEDDGGPECVDGSPELRQVFALGDDSHVVFEREHTSRAGPEDCLVIRENESVHRYLFLSCAGAVTRHSPHRRGGGPEKQCLQFGQCVRIRSCNLSVISHYDSF